MADYLEDLTGKSVQVAGVLVPDRHVLNFVSGATVVDNPGNQSTDVTVTGGGGGGGSGVVAAKTSNYSILAGDQDTTFTNAGASGSISLVLPAATVTRSFAFSVEVAQVLEIIAIGSDVLRIGGTQSAAAGNLQSSVIGSTLVLFCTKAGVWSAMGGVSGTWVVT